MTIKLISKQNKKEIQGKRMCRICGYSKGVEKCHIIPRLIIRLMPAVLRIDGNIVLWEKEKWLGEGDGYVIDLCRNHHMEYDSFLLEKNEIEKIRVDIIDALDRFIPVFNEMSRQGFIYSDRDRNKDLQGIVFKWANNQNVMFSRI